MQLATSVIVVESIAWMARLNLRGSFRIAAGRAKFFKAILQCCESFPEEGFHHLVVAVFVGMGKPVSAGRCSSPNRLEFCCMVTESIADIVETDRMSERTVKQTHNMAPC